MVTDVEAGLSPTAGLLGVSEGLVMDKGGMHVVPGTGQVGSALAAHLAGLGVAVRAVSRHRPATMSGGADWRVADITDPEADAGAAQGPLAVYQCVGAPYTRWPELFPPLRLAGAAWRSGERRTSSARAAPGGQLLSRPLG
ncbi:MAG TPA: hypothetical protein VGS62_11230 [Streptosporangiaceae bacterium]|nr:hypothetical protein [Streptosporangiaceae bacterium]